MANWSDLFAKHIVSTLLPLPKEEILARYGWVQDYVDKARAILSAKNLAEMPAQEIYAALDRLKVPLCQIRMTNLGRVNQAEEVIDGIKRLLREPGDFAVKYRAGKIPQAGVVTLSQILSLVQPQRFAIRNTPFTRALAKQIPFYTAKALDELDYEAYLDLCRELARVAEEGLKPAGLKEWGERHRFLFLYALLAVK